MSDEAASLPAAEAGAAPGPGARLKAAREARGLALGAVAETLHVAPRIVAAMEANEFDAFDAPVYAKGFLRKYAGLVGVAEAEVIGAYEALTQLPSQPTLIPAMSVVPGKPALAAPSRAPLAALLAVGAIALAAGGYYWWTGHGPARVAPAAAVRPALEPAPVAAEGTAQPAAAATPAAPPVAAAEAAPPAEPRARAAEATAAPVAPPARRRAAAAASAEEPLVIHGLRECWVEVYAPGGARLVYDLVRPGETRVVPGPGPWKVFLGYADGARLTVGERAIVVPPGRRASATARFAVARDGAVQ